MHVQFIRWICVVAALMLSIGTAAGQGVGSDRQTEAAEDLLLTAPSLDEVVVSAKVLRTRRSLKDNPAFAIVNDIVNHIDEYRPSTNGTASRERRDVTSVALDNHRTGILKYELKHNPEIFLKYLSYDATPGDPVVYISCHEKSYVERFDEHGNSIRPTAIYKLDKTSGETALTRLETALSVQHSATAEGMTAFSRRTGIDDFLSEDEIEGPLNHYIGNTDIFSGDVCIIGNRFPSPISHFGTIFYRFAISDTVVINGQPCIDIVFAPRDGRSFSFVGHLFVDPASHYLHHISMSTPMHMRLNFVKGISMIQSFRQNAEGRIDLVHETLICRFAANILGLERLGGAALRRDVSYRDYRDYRNYSDYSDYKDNNTAGIDLQETEGIPPSGSSYADLPPSLPYRQTKGLIGELRKRPGYRLLEGIGGMAYTRYFPSDPLKPSLWYGPVGSMISWNNVEGIRLRPGFVTSANLHPQLMARGYVAWGTRDHRWKYMAEVEYSFNKKVKYFSEHPRNYLRLRSDYDILPLGNRQPGAEWDNLISSINHPYHYPYAFQHRQELAYANEYRFGLTWEAVIRHRALSDPAATFQPEYFPVGGFHQTELELNLRFAPGEVYKLEVDNRTIVNKETPVFTLSHTMARKGLLGTAYNYQRTLFTYQQRVRFHGYGFMDNSVRAGRLWTSDVPVPLRLVPPTTPNTIGPNGLFSDIDPMEMATDRYVSWSIKCRTKGIIFNHIPLIRRFGWREVIGARTLWLSETLLPTSPKSSISNRPSNAWQPIPYVKLIAGISNIFDVLEVDYIYRLTHREAFSSDSDGLELKLKLRF